MFLHFPNLSVLRLALMSGIIPEDVPEYAARFGFDDDQSLWIQPAELLGEEIQTELRRLDVNSFEQCKVNLPHEAAHWLQVFPLMRDPHAGDIGDKTAVLFELSNSSQLADIATEILRLGNDRQSVHWLENGDEGKTLLRVVGPPYYSLLRAIDSFSPRNGAPTAYREIAPRVWVQVGFTHPLGAHIKPPAGQWLLLAAPHQWTCVPEAKLHDIYDAIDFLVPDGGAAWHDVEQPTRLQIPITLTPGSTSEAAELWILREPGIAQLEDLVCCSDNDLLARLAFAVTEKAGERVVVVRVRPSKIAPPMLTLDGLACRSYLRIPNLFVPIGAVLHPPLRRDAVIKLLAADKTRITWLMPSSPTDSFTPESLPDDAFRPLAEWIDYVLEHEQEAIKTWLAATRFQFDRFIGEDNAPMAKSPRRNDNAAGNG